MDFRGLDLNLLVAFNALMEEQNVTRAAGKASVSQPAMSAALARLRSHLPIRCLFAAPADYCPRRERKRSMCMSAARWTK